MGFDPPGSWCFVNPFRLSISLMGNSTRRAGHLLGGPFLIHGGAMAVKVGTMAFMVGIMAEFMFKEEGE